MAEPVVEQPGLRVARVDIAAAHVLHCAPADAGRLGLPLPMLRLLENGDRRALHLAPDEWLLIGWTDGYPVPADIPHSLVEVTSRSLGLALSGPAAARLLCSACPLDLDRLPELSCTRTLFDKVQIVLERGKDCFRMQYTRSFDSYMVGLVRRAAEDLLVQAA